MSDFDALYRTNGDPEDPRRRSRATRADQVVTDYINSFGTTNACEYHNKVDCNRCAHGDFESRQGGDRRGYVRWGASTSERRRLEIHDVHAYTRFCEWARKSYPTRVDLAEQAIAGYARMSEGERARTDKRIDFITDRVELPVDELRK